MSNKRPKSGVPKKTKPVKTNAIPDGDIDYHITFPTKFDTEFNENEMTGDVNNDEKIQLSSKEVQSFDKTKEYPDPDEFVDDTHYAGEKRNEPVVILLGWMGAQDSELVNYSRFYDKHGCVTIRYSADKEVVVFRSTQLHTPAKLILELLKDLNLHKNPIFIHAFSDTGAMIYRYITEYLHINKEYWDIKLAGVIFDSGPKKYSYLKAITGISNSVYDYKNVYSRITPLVWLYSVFFVWVCTVKNIMTSKRERVNLQFDYFHALNNDPSHSPQLYLYSENDSRINEADIIETMNYRKKAGRKIQMHKFSGDGGHTHESFKKNSFQYSCLCIEFIESCLFDLEMELF